MDPLATTTPGLNPPPQPVSGSPGYMPSPVQDPAGSPSTTSPTLCQTLLAQAPCLATPLYRGGVSQRLEDKEVAIKLGRKQVWLDAGLGMGMLGQPPLQHPVHSGSQRASSCTVTPQHSPHPP